MGGLEVHGQYQEHPRHRPRRSPLDLASFDGPLLVVNVASRRCGLTPQYTKLEELAKGYGRAG